MFCPKCGNEMGNAQFCASCGAAAPAANPAAAPMMNASGLCKEALIGFIVSLSGALVCLLSQISEDFDVQIFFSLLGLAAFIVGIVFGAIGLRKVAAGAPGKGFALTGLIVGIVGASISTIVTITELVENL